MPPSRDEILRELAGATAAFTDLEHTRDKLQARIATLQAELAAIAPTINIRSTDEATFRHRITSNASRKGKAISVPIPRAHGRLPGALREQENRPRRLRARLLEQMAPRTVPSQVGWQMQRLHQPVLHPRGRAADRGASAGSARDGRL